MNILFTLITFICFLPCFAQERQQLSNAHVKSKTEYIYQLRKNGKPDKGRFLSKTLYNKKGEAIEDSVVWVEGMWRKGIVTYTEDGNYLTDLNIVKKEDGSIDTLFTNYSYEGDSVKKTFDKYGFLKSREVKVNDTLRKVYNGHGIFLYTITEKGSLTTKYGASNCHTSITASPEGQVWSHIVYYLDKEGKTLKTEIDNSRIEKYTYDEKGRKTADIETTTQNKPLSKTLYKYNEKGLTTETTSYDYKGKPVDRIKCTYEYFE